MFPDVTFLQLDLYGWCLALGVIAALVVFRVYADLLKMPARVQNTCLISAVVAIAAGYGFAVLFQGLYNFLLKGEGLSKETGATFYGGLIGGAAVFLLLYFTAGRKVCGKEQIFSWIGRVTSVAACSVCVAHAIGRIGCLMAGCCHGRIVGYDNGFWHPNVWNPATGSYGAYVVPTQLIESLYLFALFAALSVLALKTKLNALSVYGIAYGIFRFVIEFFRDDDRGSFIPGLTPSQFWSVLLVLAGAGTLLFFLLRRQRSKRTR